MPILSTISSVLVVLWIFGVVGLFYLGAFVHVLLLAAVLLAGLRVWQEYDVSVAELSRALEHEAREFVASHVIPVFYSWLVKTRVFLAASISALSRRNLSLRRRARSV